MRKVLGGLFLFFIAGPVLGAVIWGIGIAQGVLGEGFLAEVPQEVIRQIPEMIEETFEAAKAPGALTDADAAGWVEAAAKAEKTPSQALEESGIYAWLEQELGGTITDTHRALRGEIAPKDVILDLRPLKAALTSAPMRTWLNDVLAQLPVCDAAGMERWDLAVRRIGKNKRLPPCNPGVSLNAVAIQTVIDGMVEFPDEVSPIDEKDLPHGLNTLQVANKVLWVAFLVPLVLLLIGAAICSSKLGGFLRWAGIGTLFGSLSALILVWSTRGLIATAVTMDPAQWHIPKDTPFWTSEASQALARRVMDLTSFLLEKLFEPVVTTGLVALAAGAILLGLSFLPKDEGRA
ncbi:MAG: hypothetical protein ABIK09_12135 [Pseudomonadota bacterium]